MSTTRANTSQERHKKRKLMKTGLRQNEKRLLFPSPVEKGRDVHMRRARPAGRPQGPRPRAAARTPALGCGARGAAACARPHALAHNLTADGFYSVRIMLRLN